MFVYNYILKRTIKVNNSERVKCNAFLLIILNSDMVPALVFPQFLKSFRV